MYTGSYSESMRISGITILSALAMIMACATLLILPIVMALKFNCKRKKLIIFLDIILFFIGIGNIVAFIMIAVDKKNSKYYENTGKNIAWLHIVLYASSILALFTPLAKVKYFENYDINGITSFNLSFFLGKKDSLIGTFMKSDDYKLIAVLLWIMIAILVIGLIINLIFRDARKLISVNAILQTFNSFMITIFAMSFNDSLTVPGMAFLLNALISIIFIISLYVTVNKVSYVDN